MRFSKKGKRFKLKKRKIPKKFDFLLEHDIDFLVSSRLVTEYECDGICI